MLKKIVFLGGILLAVAIGGAGYVYHQFATLAARPITPTAEAFFVIEKGTSSQQLARSLQQAGLIDEQEAEWLPYFIRFHPELSRFKAGVYALDAIPDLKSLLRHFNSGKEVQLDVRFIEGKTFKEWRQQLAKAKFLTQTLAGKSEVEIARQLGISQPTLEGWLAPDTYRYVPYSTDIELLKRAYQQQQKALDSAWQNRAEELPLKNAYELLILASIVEKETGIAAERPQVASVFINRLRHNWKLQTDPTVIYGLGERYDGNIRKRDLLEPTPYNTYVIDGLPPTPIAMPSQAAIKAAAQPDSTPYFFFVADGTGGHKFSRTLNEHNQAVRDWLKIEKMKKSEQK